MQSLSVEIIAHMIDALVEKGWCEWPNAISNELCLQLLNELDALDEQGQMEEAGIGRGQQHQKNHGIRRDSIYWLNGQSEAQQQYLAQMALLQQQLNRELFMGLFEYECHYALYSPGDFYKKHSDSFRGNANRMITTVLYLNPQWQNEWGGELVIYSEDGEQVLHTAMPEIGKLVVFLSEQTPHEVLPTQQPRASIAGWFRCNASTAINLDPAR
ncbi:2OG-Fe(II) oxygenase [Thiomicrorhabdus sediminis]|uniref:2OG-Fe(II) oxygenase n=1 Tax=Thiomicrorhabdus sediminis TaxID=2580412 RepID=A0A4P9K3C1_9GAMM|nr:2OG-Fe(II) oxygenase [Thiomicrorhabdus sediminis]QCU89384.1 2OG-Fe(II) oxygenase [Thiomicrorhabdus sediminis]